MMIHAAHSNRISIAFRRAIARYAPAGIGLLAFALLTLVPTATYAQDNDSMNEGIYSYTMKDIDGKDVPLATYRGKVLLVVNTASKCGYTPQYETLEKLYRTYNDRGFEVLGFPANNFGGQEPGSNEQIKEFCSTKFDVTFRMFSKISVKGEDRHPLYAYLQDESEIPGEIKWNFYKFLIDENGRVVARWDSRTDPMSDDLTAKVEEYLNK